jgi:hypothetical protein
VLAGCAAGARNDTQPETISRALVAADGRQVVVPVTAGGCVQGSALTATETGTTVTLVLRQILSGASACPANLIIGTADVTLRHPLSCRSLIDGTTGRRVPYFDGRTLLRVTYLPPGYRFSAYLPFPYSPAFTTWQREFTSPSLAPVDIEQSPGNATFAPSWPPVSRTTVQHRPATVGALTGNGEVFGREISWRADGFTFVVYTVQVRAGQHLLSAAQLTGIAAGLRS